VSAGSDAPAADMGASNRDTVRTLAMNQSIGAVDSEREGARPAGTRSRHVHVIDAPALEGRLSDDPPLHPSPLFARQVRPGAAPSYTTSRVSNESGHVEAERVAPVPTARCQSDGVPVDAEGFVVLVRARPRAGAWRRRPRRVASRRGEGCSGAF
jgi:hypothetical protein